MSSQFRRQRARQVKGRSHTGQVFSGFGARPRPRALLFLSGILRSDWPVGGIGDVGRLVRPVAVPLGHEATVAVMVGALLVLIKAASTAWIGADAGEVLPVAVIAGDVEIHQVMLEERGPVAPIDTVFVDQAAGDNLPAAITHPARVDQLMHKGIDQREVGVALAPAGKVAWLEGAAHQSLAGTAGAEQVAGIIS